MSREFNFEIKSSSRNIPCMIVSTANRESSILYGYCTILHAEILSLMEISKGSGLRTIDFIQVWRSADKDIPTMGAIKMTINSLVDSINKHGNIIKITKTKQESRPKRIEILYSLNDGVKIAVAKDINH